MLTKAKLLIDIFSMRCNAQLFGSKHSVQTQVQEVFK